jgi:opine dehydrogenase
MTMKVAIVGAGAVGLSSAALLKDRGHDVRVWSALQHENKALNAAGGVTSEGALEGHFPIPAVSNPEECIRGADAVMIAAPAFAHASLMAAIAPHISDKQIVIVHTATGLTSLILARQLAQRGVRSTIVDLGTSVCTSRKSGATSVKVAPLKAGVDMAALPADRTESGRAFMQQLFGDLFTSRENVLSVSLNNHNAVYHVPALVFSLALVERGEDWNIWANTTPLIARYVERLDDERLAVAKAYGVAGVPVGDYVRRSVSVQGDDLAKVFAAAAVKRPNPTGPKTLDDRYITEDIPYGLVFFAAVAKAAGVRMPLTEQLTAFAATVFRRDFASDGNSLADLGLASLKPPEIVRVVTNGF